jgi:hypothetical protein
LVTSGPSVERCRNFSVLLATIISIVFLFRTLSPLHELLDGVWLGFDKRQQDTRWRIWLAAALLPIPHRPQWEMVGAGKLILCLARTLADRRHIDGCRYPPVARFPDSMSDSVTEASCDLVEGTLHFSS